MALKEHSLKVFFRDKSKRRELAVGLVLLFLMAGLAAFRVCEAFEYLFLDLRFQLRGSRPFTSPIALIGVDEASLDVFGRWPWRRDLHAGLIDLLRHNSFRPACLAFDLLFENKNTAELAGDEALVFQSQNMKDRLLMAYFFEKGPVAFVEEDEGKRKRLEEFAISAPEENIPEKLDQADRISMPFLALAENSELAFVNTPVDPDGRSRRAQLLMRYQGKIYPSMDLLMALNYWKSGVRDIRIEKRAIIVENPEIGRKVIPVNKYGEMLINYYRNPEKISAYSFVQILKEGKAWMGGKDPGLLRSLKDKIVVVGVTALGLGDRRTTPFRQYETGISLHAQAVANILENDFLVRAPVWLSCLLLLGVGLLAIFITLSLSVVRSLPLVITLGFFYLAAAYLFFIKGIWIDVAVHLLALIVLFIGIVSFRYFHALEELKRTQAQLIQSAKMAALGQLSAGIAHEFRNIMNSINLNVECCSLPGISPERLEKYLGMYKKTVQQANLILEGLLTFARRSESNKKKGRLKKTVEDTLFLVEKEMMRCQIEVKPELEDVPEIAYDAGQISQVVMNLMNNARDAFQEREGKEITLRLKEHSDKIRLDIQDNGSGIAPQVLKRLFEPFVTTKEAGKGTGLGLSVCHGIIRGHNGTITVTTALGRGTTWHIDLPKE